jgi:hypothetical protein
VSDTFASALWILDTLFNMARVGVDGINVHTFHHAFYEPFDVTEHDGAWSAQVRSEYYGMLMFAQAAPPGSQLLPVSGRPPSTLRVWSTRDTGGRVRVILINDSRSRAVTVAVRPPAPAPAGSPAAPTPTATAVQLRAPHADATSAVTIDGQSFGATTTTGIPAGVTSSATVPATAGAFVVTVPAASATLLTIGAR